MSESPMSVIESTEVRYILPHAVPRVMLSARAHAKREAERRDASATAATPRGAVATPARITSRPAGAAMHGAKMPARSPRGRRCLAASTAVRGSKRRQAPAVARCRTAPRAAVCPSRRRLAAAPTPCVTAASDAARAASEAPRAAATGRARVHSTPRGFLAPGVGAARTARVVVHRRLGKHRVVLDLRFAQRRAVARDEDELGCANGGRNARAQASGGAAFFILCSLPRLRAARAVRPAHFPWRSDFSVLL